MAAEEEEDRVNGEGGFLFPRLSRAGIFCEALAFKLSSLFEVHAIIYNTTRYEIISRIVYC